MTVLYLDPFTAVYCCRAVVSEDAKTTLASGLQTLSLQRESNTVSRCVRPWIKFTPEYPFNSTLAVTDLRGAGRVSKPITGCILFILRTCSENTLYVLRNLYSIRRSSLFYPVFYLRRFPICSSPPKYMFSLFTLPRGCVYVSPL